MEVKKPHSFEAEISRENLPVAVPIQSACPDVPLQLIFCRHAA